LLLNDKRGKNKYLYGFKIKVYMNFRLLKFLLALSVFFSIASCRKDDQRPIIPYVYVNITLYPDLLTNEYIPVSGWVYVTGGYRGIIVYRMTSNEFMAYERTCPYDPDKDCARVEVESSNITAVDSCCGSQYILTDGSPIRGPSGYSLEQYRTSYDGNQLRIFN
jgi:nitrite reductase/ring-hydroxylating ferredoxin subunit